MLNMEPSMVSRPAAAVHKVNYRGFIKHFTVIKLSHCALPAAKQHPSFSAACITIVQLENKNLKDIPRMRGQCHPSL